MGMDIDAVFAKSALRNIGEIVSKLPHGEREKICDEIIEFQDKLCKKYGFPSAFSEKEPSIEGKIKKLEEEAEVQKQIINDLNKSLGYEK